MLEGAAQVVKTLGVIYTELPLALLFESIWRCKQSKRQIEGTFLGGMDGRQARPLDPAQGAGKQDDRAVYGPAGARGSDFFCHAEDGIRYPGGGRVPDFHQR